jgi:hypothetical protein
MSSLGGAVKMLSTQVESAVRRKVFLSPSSSKHVIFQLLDPDYGGGANENHGPRSGICLSIYTLLALNPFTYDHRILRTTHPVCSAIFKQDTGGLVVKWVTIGESLLLYVFAFLLPFFAVHTLYLLY